MYKASGGSHRHAPAVRDLFSFFSAFLIQFSPFAAVQVVTLPLEILLPLGDILPEPTLRKRVGVRTFLADSSYLSAELLSGALRRCQNYFDLVGYALNSQDAFRKLDQLKPSIALVSIELLDGPTAGYKVLQCLREKHSQTAVVALLKESERDLVLQSFRFGARGVVSREQPFRLLAKCLRRVHEGSIWASEDQVGFVLDLLKEEKKAPASQHHTLDQLTDREREVAILVADGMQNAQIGASLGISEHTIRNYVMRIYEKLGVSNRVQLTRYCVSSLVAPHNL